MRAAIDKLPAEAASWRRDLIEARIAIARGEGEKALPILDALAEQYPKAPGILRVRVDALEALERWDDAMLALRKWSDATRKQMAYNHVRSLERPSNPGNLRCTVTNTSWERSCTSASRTPRYLRTRKT